MAETEATETEAVNETVDCLICLAICFAIYQVSDDSVDVDYAAGLACNAFYTSRCPSIDLR